MVTLCYGGSFNPIHQGHLICVRAAAEALSADRVVLIPNRQSPHKQGLIDLAPAADRLAMCRLAVAGDPLFAVNDLELSRPGPSYTFDTVRTLRRDGWTPIHWLIGADQVPALPQWHEADTLLAEVRFAIMARPGWAFEWAALPERFRSLADAVLPTPLVEISSTDIRRRVQNGRSIRYLTPDAVVEHIATNELYRGG